MREKMISEFLSDLDTTKESGGLKNEREAITFWVSPEVKQKFSRMQNQTRKRFGKKLRDFLLEVIQATEAKTA